DYFNNRYVPSLTKKVCESSIYEYLENDLGLTIGFAKKEITVQQVSNEDKKYLDLEDYNMVVVVKSYTYLDDMSLFQYTESRHRPDKFRFVDFARRK
ncbi:UTRA domain-containing protein, partial [Schnuerera sp.]|uniref:UTRA domain-containing protein n=1 Tax=Schnuerera sp. TaxID=2794844 RepID=UPI002D001BF4